MSYANNRDWEKIQKYLPIENQMKVGTEPQEYYISIQNIEVHIDHYKVDKPKGRVIIFHGVGGNGRLLSFIAIPLMRSGFEVICPDLPLYGHSKYQGVVTYDMWVSCGTEIVNYFQREKRDTFLFGLSAGGMLAYQIAARCSEVSGIMATCILDQRNRSITKQTAANPFMAVTGNAILSIIHRVIGSMKIPMKMIANMKAIANNQDLANLLMQDKRSSGTRVSLAFVHSMLNPHLEIEPEDFTKCPFLLVHPEEDHWTDVQLSRLFFDRLVCKKELWMLEGAGHFPIEPVGLKQLETYCVAFMEKCLTEEGNYLNLE